nr:hypothetical protein [Tanacetum cinerariifolium]
MYPRFLQLLIRKQVDDLSTHTSKYASPTLTQKVFANMRRVRKGFSRVETPLFEGMLVRQEIEKEGDADEHVEDVTVGDDAQGDDTTAHGEVPTVTEEPSIPSPTPTIPPSQPPQDIPSTSQRVDTSDNTVIDDKSNQERMINEMDKDDVVVLMDKKEEDKKVEEAKNPRLKFTKLIWIMLQKDPKEESTTSSIISTKTKSKDKGNGIMVEEPMPLKKKQQIEIDEEYARKLHAEINTYIDWDVAIDHVKLKAKEDPAV